MVRTSLVLAGVTLGSVATWAAVAPVANPRDLRQDVDAGGRIDDIAGGKRFFVNGRSDAAPGRAELRGPSSLPEVTARGHFRLIEGGRWVSVLQVLNVTAAGKTGGPAKPVSQLGVRFTPGSADRYHFFVVRGAQRCAGVPDFTVGSSHRISVTARAGGDPEYVIDGVRCAYENTNGSKAGRTLEGRRVTGGHYFYAKLGAYQTHSNQSRRCGDSAVEWTDIHI